VSAEHAALAGTLESGTCLTPNTEGDDFEEERYTNGLVFLLKYTEDGPTIDSSIDVASCLGSTWQGVLAAEKLTGVENRMVHQVASAVQMMRLRTKFDGAVYGPYLFKFTEFVEPKELQEFLRNIDPDHRKKLLKGAEI
jgi:hypothetical protein